MRNGRTCWMWLFAWLYIVMTHLLGHHVSYGFLIPVTPISTTTTTTTTTLASPSRMTIRTCTIIKPKTNDHRHSVRVIMMAKQPPQLPSKQKTNRFTQERRKQLGINQYDEEYDLDVALNNNTDPLISKIIAGSLILTLLVLLVVGVIIPYTTDYGEGVCNALLTQGRCN